MNEEQAQPKLTKQQIKDGPQFEVLYEMTPGQIDRKLSYTRDANDAYADAMELMGAKNIEKHYYNPNIRQWYRYHAEGLPE